MSKRNANHPGYYKVQGAAIEDRDTTAMSKQALDRELARRKRQGGAARKAAPAVKRAGKVSGLATAPFTEPPEVLARAHDREFARMNERRPVRKRVKAAPVRAADYPSYLGSTARGVIRRVARVALAPFALARAVVDHFRDHDRHH